MNNKRFVNTHFIAHGDGIGSGLDPYWCLSLHSFFSSHGGLWFFASNLRASRRSGRSGPSGPRCHRDGEGRDLLVPACGWWLGSEDGGASSVAGLADLPDSLSGTVAQWSMTRTSMRPSGARTKAFLAGH